MDENPKIRPKSFVEELMDLITVEAQMEGTVSVFSLEDLINKHFPEYQFNAEGQYWYWYPRRKSNTSDALIGQVWDNLIREQLERPLSLMIGPELPTVGDYITFDLKRKTDKKDEQS